VEWSSILFLCELWYIADDRGVKLSASVIHEKQPSQ